jgi:hypothetical protein
MGGEHRVEFSLYGRRAPSLVYMGGEHRIEFSLYGRRAPSPKKKIVLSLVYMGGEHRAQTGVWQMLNFVSVRMIKGSSSSGLSLCI